MTSAETISPETIVASGKHAFIEASAGSGKTTLLTSLFTEIIASGQARIGQILCVTFTEKAASELKAKIFRKLSERQENPRCREAVACFSENQIGTIHSFCLKSLALAPAARLAEPATESEGDEEIFEEAREWVYRIQWATLEPQLLAQLLAEVRFGTGGANRQFDADLKQKAIWCFAAASMPVVPIVEDACDVKDAVSFKAWTLLHTVRRMQEIAVQKNLMTFSRMVTGLAETLSDEAFANRLRAMFSYALIDEFQDTDQVQWEIFKSLFLATEGTHRLYVVGDPKQAIYKFRGADVFIYLAVRKELERRGALIAQLGVNYRSNADLLRFHDYVFSGEAPTAVWACAEISYNPPHCGRAGSTPVPGAAVEILTSDEYRAELVKSFAEAAVQRMAEWRRQNPEWTCAIIAYRHSSLGIFAEALRQAGIEFSYYRQQPDFGRTEVLHLKTLLFSLTLEKDEGHALAELTLFLKDRPDARSWYERLFQLGRDGRIVSLLTWIAQDAHVLHRILECGGDSTHYYAWKTLIQTLMLACGNAVHDLESLLRYLQNLEGGDEDNPTAVDMLREKSAVTLLTVQSSKGLDWNIVVVADGHNDNRWANFAFFHDPSGKAVVPADIEDFKARGEYLLEPEAEARISQLNLLYVALTRPKDRLIVFSAPSSKTQKPGPVAFFLSKLAGESLPEGCACRPLGAIPLATPQKRASRSPEPAPLDHNNIALRYGERTSFTALAHAEFEETEFLEDVLPRGTETGQLLHGLLEEADLAALSDLRSAYAREIREKIQTEVSARLAVTDDRVQPISDRIFSLIHATATARLPLANGRFVRLCDIAADNLWREMPFWSSADTHKVLRGKQDSVRRIMHGYMDLVFTTDGRDFYILDYKSNSLSGIDPALIGRYVEEHYSLQAEIYAEALNAYLTRYYPGKGLRVAGCFFFFLRYLNPDADTGVHYIDAEGLRG